MPFTRLGTQPTTHRAAQPTARRLMRWSTAVLLLVVAGVHLRLVPDHLEEAPYVGWLFILLSVGCVALAGAIVWVDHPGVWAASGATCLAAILAYLASRTIGLPQLGDDVGNWTEPLSYPALAAELLVIVLAGVRLAAADSMGAPS